MFTCNLKNQTINKQKGQLCKHQDKKDLVCWLGDWKQMSNAVIKHDSSKLPVVHKSSCLGIMGVGGGQSNINIICLFCHTWQEIKANANTLITGKIVDREGTYICTSGIFQKWNVWKSGFLHLLFRHSSTWIVKVQVYTWERQSYGLNMVDNECRDVDASYAVCCSKFDIWQSEWEVFWGGVLLSCPLLSSVPYFSIQN